MGLSRRTRDANRDRRSEPAVGRHRRRFPAVRMARRGRDVEPRHRLLLETPR
jgi:hypothetical protein